MASDVMSCASTKTSWNDLPLDALGRSRRFIVLSCARPWFRAFHLSWISFFLAFLGWFSIVPALEYMVDDESNDITKDSILTSNIVSVLGTVLIRLAIGPVLERYGPSKVQSTLLFYGGIVVMLSATVHSATALYVVRFAISFVGGAFVPCQFWTMMMFAQNVVGRANAFAGGWGNLGGGFTTLFVAGLISLFKNVADESTAWRYAVLVPGAIMVLFSVPLLILGDDCPQGKWSERRYRKKSDSTEKATESDQNQTNSVKGWLQSLRESGNASAYTDVRVWILFVQYACCFGVELTINNSMTSYLYRGFISDDIVNGTSCAEKSEDAEGNFIAECSVLGKDTAAMVSALFGLQNLYARSLGGIVSDIENGKSSMRGRLWVQLGCILLEGIFLIIFSQMRSLPAAISLLVVFSIFVQMSEGSTFSLVPFVHENIGIVAGVVGAGGNLGAVLWATMIRQVGSLSDSYLYMGILVCCSSLLTLVTNLRGTTLFKGDNEPLGYGSNCPSPRSTSSSDDHLRRQPTQSSESLSGVPSFELQKV